MRISFSPICRDGILVISKTGDVLTINGDPVDLSVVPDGASLPSEAVDNAWVSGTVDRIGGVLHVTLRLPHGQIPSPAVAFPADVIDPPDGPIAVPQNEGSTHGSD